MRYMLVGREVKRVSLVDREVKRVPPGFNHPVGTPWPGYLTEDRTEPPTGPGWQLWETVSEGSPVSPVFTTALQLAAWLAPNHRVVTEYWTADRWLRWLQFLTGEPIVVPIR